MGFLLSMALGEAKRHARRGREIGGRDALRYRASRRIIPNSNRSLKTTNGMARLPLISNDNLFTDYLVFADPITATPSQLGDACETPTRALYVELVDARA